MVACGAFVSGLISSDTGSPICPDSEIGVNVMVAVRSRSVISNVVWSVMPTGASLMETSVATAFLRPNDAVAELFVVLLRDKLMTSGTCC